MLHRKEVRDLSAPIIAPGDGTALRASGVFLSIPAVLETAREWSFSGGAFLRILVDLGSIGGAITLGWLALEMNVFSPFPEAESFTLAIGLLAFAVLAALACSVARLYGEARTGELRVKIVRIGAANLAALLTVVAAMAVSGRIFESMLWFIAGTSLVSTILMSLTRTAAEVLRSEYAASLKLQPRGHLVDSKKVLVIGGAGYIGSALVRRLLDDNFKVVVLDAMHFGEGALVGLADRPDCTIVRADFRDAEILSNAIEGVGSVIHLGGLVGDPACEVDHDLTIDVNVTATKLVGEIAKAHRVRRFIFASSCSVYGACDEIVAEEAHFNPQSLYARTKVASEAVLNALHGPKFAVTNLRFATIYGVSGRTRFDLVVNLLTAKAVRDGLITVYGADQWRPFVHVDDVARAILLILQAPIDAVGGQVFNVGSDNQNFTLGQIADLIKVQVPEARIVSDEGFVDKRNYRVSFAKICQTIGFEPTWTVEKGIAQVVALLRANTIGHYSQPAYSNVLYLRQRGAKNFSPVKIHGWEEQFMNIVAIERDPAGKLVGT